MNIDRLQRAIRAIGDGRAAMRREAEAAERNRALVNDDVAYMPRDRAVQHRKQQQRIVLESGQGV